MNPGSANVCFEELNRTGWDGVVSLECSGTDENTRKSVEWTKGVVKELKSKRARK